jgi:hypothetical protein
MRVRGQHEAGSDPVEDKQTGQLVRWALIEQTRSQEPSPAVWQAISSRTVRRSTLRPHMSLRWAPLASGFVAIALMLGSTFTFWSYDPGTSNREQAPQAVIAAVTPDPFVESVAMPVHVASSTSSTSNDAQHQPSVAMDTQRQIATTGDTQRQSAAASDIPHQPPVAASSARPVAPQTAQVTQNSSALEYGPDLPRAVRRAGIVPLPPQPAPAAPALEDVIKGRSATPI